MPLQGGEVFAGYTIVRLLGSGGMGEVYLAQHPRLPRRDALKILPANLTADREFRQRFNREADLAAGLWHPNIVGIHDRGEYLGQLWISMDYVDGADALALLRNRYPSGMPLAEAFPIVTTVADALDHAHSHGLLHRDVKPANILLGGPTPRGRRIMLADFGIARQLGEVSGLTATNMIVGTTAYAAPEQLRGADIDGRADQYALGCTAFQLLTGAAPFANSNPAVVIAAHLSELPPLIGDRRAELAGLDAAFARALAKEPGERYSSCSDFAMALRDRPTAASATMPAVAARPARAVAAPSMPAPPARRQRRVRPAALLFAIVALVLFGLVAAVGEQLLRGQPPQPTDGATSAPQPQLTDNAAPQPQPPAGAVPALQLSRYITDQSGVLAAPDRAAVERAIDKLYNERNVRLWVVYVNTFSGLRPFTWAEDTWRANGLTDTDALLAVATDERRFSFRVPAAVARDMAIDVEAIRRDRIEPAVRRGEWPRAAVVAAEGLDTRAGERVGQAHRRSSRR
ncbi:serine/threonine-protein kinase [Mycobacterium sp.]|uniref:serine/threonine-protein kinase n=1 Tax=Mycobacterium sp. TaxID=1785 RepID=UPI0031D1112E